MSGARRVRHYRGVLLLWACAAALIVVEILAGAAVVPGLGRSTLVPSTVPATWPFSGTQPPPGSRPGSATSHPPTSTGPGGGHPPTTITTGGGGQPPPSTTLLPTLPTLPTLPSTSVTVPTLPRTTLPDTDTDTVCAWPGRADLTHRPHNRPPGWSRHPLDLEEGGRHDRCHPTRPA